MMEHHSHIAPGAILAGGVKVGYNSLAGRDSTIYLQVRIGHAAAISNGGDIAPNVPDRAVHKTGHSRRQTLRPGR